MPSTSDPPAIDVDHVSVTYSTPYEQRPTVRSALLRPRSRRQVRITEAVKDVTLRVPHGTVLGVIGANGAGKSTLMKAIAGIVPPTRGRITVDGELSTVLALGVGFNKDLTGRDNIVLGGVASGRSRRQMLAQCDGIARFAGLQDVLDLPMRTYSTGMYSRLAFAVAVALDPDILVIDEALTTGDADFKAKSYERIRSLCTWARTIVLVSHSLGSVTELCTDAVWLHQGRVVLRGTPITVVSAYTEFSRTGVVAGDVNS